MNRKVKNVIMIAVLIIVCVLSYFTMNAAVKSSMPDNGTSGKEFGGTPPNFNNNEFSEEDIPQKPSEDSGDRKKTNRGELSENTENGEMPNIEEMPEDFEENFKNGNFSKREFKSNISAIYYILFAVEGLIISSLLIYLIMSKFNSKTLKETLDTSRKIIAYIILVLIITIGLTVVQSMLATNVFATNNMKQFENIQSPRNNSNNSNNSNNANEINEVENI